MWREGKVQEREEMYVRRKDSVAGRNGLMERFRKENNMY